MGNYFSHWTRSFRTRITEYWFSSTATMMFMLKPTPLDYAWGRLARICSRHLSFRITRKDDSLYVIIKSEKISSHGRQNKFQLLSNLHEEHKDSLDVQPALAEKKSCKGNWQSFKPNVTLISVKILATLQKRNKAQNRKHITDQWHSLFLKKGIHGTKWQSGIEMIQPRD